MKTSEARATIAELAGDQWGMVTTAQVRASGISRMLLTRMTDDGELERVIHGVYGTPGATADPHFRAKAHWLALRPHQTAAERLRDDLTGAVASYATAASLHAVGDLLDDRIEMTLPRRYQSIREDLRIHVMRIEPQDVTLVGGLPTTTVDRTIADLIRGRHDLGHVADVLRDAVRTARTTPSQVEETLARVLGEKRTDSVLPDLLRAAELDVDSLAKRVLASDLGEMFTSAAIRDASPQLALTSLTHGAQAPVRDARAPWADLLRYLDTRSADLVHDSGLGHGLQPGSASPTETDDAPTSSADRA